MTTDAQSARAGELPEVAPLARRRIRPKDALFHAGVLGAVLIALGVLAWLMVSILIAGLPGLDLDFLRNSTSTSAQRAGFNSALRGSLVLMFWTAAIALPIGFAAAVYLEKFAATTRAELSGRAIRRERDHEKRVAAGDLSGLGAALSACRVRASRMWARIGPPVNRIVEVNISNLAAVPSIIYGLLGLALFISIIGFNKSLLAGGFTLALLVLPIVIIAAREAVRAVPVSIEQGAMALGATRLQAVMRQVVPAAFPGMLTGAILAMSRAIGESAPLVVVGGIVFGTQTIELSPILADENPLFAMPLQIFFWAGDPRQEFQDLAASGIIVLLGALLLMNAVAIYLRNRFSRRW